MTPTHPTPTPTPSLTPDQVTHLRDTYSPFGALDGTADLFLVIDAVGGAGHPPVRFIYATRVALPQPQHDP